MPAPKPVKTGIADTCMSISSPGYYALDGNITAPPGQTCIYINYDTTFDCRGYWIIGSGSGTGIDVSYRHNTVKNCNIINFNGSEESRGIASFNENNSIENNHLYNNYYGIYIDGWDSTLRNNVAVGNKYGFYDTYSHNTFVNNTADGNIDYGFYVWADNSTYLNNIAQNNLMDGFHLIFARSNNFDGNIVINNSNAGFYIGFAYGSSSNIFHNNRITQNKIGFWDEYSSGPNTIYNNYFANELNAHGGEIWNIPKTPGLNIVGGPYLGGNYWYGYKGADTDNDWIGDTEVPYNSGEQMTPGDYLPLIFKPAPRPICTYDKRFKAWTCN
jgi:parallel beta-helix repeat protein